MSTGRRQGEVKRSFRVESNDRENPRVMLQGIANVLAAIKIEPQRAQFGNIERGADAKTVSVKLLRGDGGPIDPKIASGTRKGVKAEIKEITEGEEYELAVTLEPPWPNNQLRGAIMVETGVPESGKTSVLYHANVKPRLATMPTRFQIPHQVEEARTLTVVAKWDGEPGTIKEARCNAPDLEVELGDTEGEKQYVRLRVPAGYNPPRRSGYSVTLITDDPEARTVRIPVYQLRAPNRRAPARTTSAAQEVRPAVRRKAGVAAQKKPAEQSPAPNEDGAKQ